VSDDTEWRHLTWDLRRRASDAEHRVEFRAELDDGKVHSISTTVRLHPDGTYEWGWFGRPLARWQR
jgi:hypothetical protein